MSDSLVGGIVDTRYELRRLIARGGMGLVFEAHHRFTRRAVALKLLPEEARGQKEMRGRLLREAHALTAVRHPHVVEVLDAGVCAEHGPYVVMEMLDGRTLDGILAARRRLSIEDVVQIGRQVCDAVAHANSRGVVHRDLKPSNFFIARNEIGEETVKIIDLGVAAVAEEQLHQLDRKLTHAHEVLGTPEYMAPEQLWGREVDARTDVYAIAMSLFECLAGEVPYLGTYPEVLVQVSNSPSPPDVRARRPEVPRALGLVLETALEKDAGSRFQSAAELGRALVAASGIAPGQSHLLEATSEESPSSFEPEPGTEPERAIQLVRKKPPKGEGSGPTLPQPAPTHRRHFERAPYVTPVLLLTESGSEIDARSEEVSEEGMLVVSPLGFPLGSSLRLQFATPVTGEMIALDATVRWTREGRGRSAMGLEFTHVPPLLRGIVSQYISMFPAAHAE